MSTTASRQSRIGQTPLSIPPEVTFRFTEPLPAPKTGRVSEIDLSGRVDIEGPLGKLHVPILPFIRIESDEQMRLHTLSVLDPNNKHQRAMWGTTRALIQNQILGVSEGHSTILRLVGVGYRATIENSAVTTKPTYPGQKFVSLKVGYSHPIELGIPEGVTASTPQPTRILLEGCEKDTLKRFAAEIREWRRPEPYKGKGIFIDGETIKLKAKKIK
ncbi:putative mitochondrial 54S ribosomal protein YmL16 [Myriangium duriaei CBS 260.36]|uniref:Mitochondrial 54S ribosomal protein YmL16 n=1 Tax=Myriangium duriaei CBS 260.36 TaxID=1168546 RepID=A0A9P4IZ87_9PEZI|nr:putative mitochondrial 54S ribosomal protein YmL16 [Myriangium duriaei CBS 260.36]